MNERTRQAEDLVELIEMDGEEWLRYKSFPLNVALLRGTYADESGNVVMDQEAATLDSLSIAQAVKNSGGKVIVQVKNVVENGTLKAKDVKIPGIYVDAIVIGKPETTGRHMQVNTIQHYLEKYVSLLIQLIQCH